MLTWLNDKATMVNKISVVTMNSTVEASDTTLGRLKIAFDDFFMPTTEIDSTCTKLANSKALKYFGKLGGFLGKFSTIVTPILEYNNSFEPYKDDLEAIKKYDPENYTKCNILAHIGAAADAASAGFARAVINTPPAVVQVFTPTKDKPEWTNKWINTVNKYVNTRGAIEKLYELWNDPVYGPKIRAFTRYDSNILEEFGIG